MTRFLLGSAILLTVVVPPAAAQQPIEGVYLKTVELCDAAKANGIESVLEQGELVLGARGFEGYEFNCAFVQSLPVTRSPGWIVTAFCEEPGYAYPELLAIMSRSEGSVDVTVSAADESEGTVAGTYHLCEGLALP